MVQLLLAAAVTEAHRTHIPQNQIWRLKSRQICGSPERSISQRNDHHRRIGRIYGYTSHFERRDFILRHRRHYPQKWCKIPNWGGWTQVEGTTYEIAFAPKEVILTVVDGWNGGSTYYMWVNYNNQYLFSESVVLPSGAKISIIISNADKANCSVYLNGNKVAEQKSFINYEYVLKKDVTVKFYRYSYRADITEG